MGSFSRGEVPPPILGTAVRRVCSEETTHSSHRNGSVGRQWLLSASLKRTQKEVPWPTFRDRTCRSRKALTFCLADPLLSLLETQFRDVL